MAPSSPDQLQNEKRALRQAMAQRRQQLSADDSARLSGQAVARLTALPPFDAAVTGTIAGFLPIRGEIDPGMALAGARARGATVVFPRVTSAAPRLRFHRADAPTDLVPGPFGLLEPAATCPELPLESIDVMIVPGLAFDLGGGRLGFGGGYYDEVAVALRAGKRGLLVGFGFELQVVARCPADARDARMDWLVTDQRAVHCGKAS
jgi:5-formyltetrahydrofolate cyclo-ligase